MRGLLTSCTIRRLELKVVEQHNSRPEYRNIELVLHRRRLTFLLARWLTLHRNTNGYYLLWVHPEPSQ